MKADFFSSLHMPFFDFHTHHSQGFQSIYNLSEHESNIQGGYFSAGIHPWNLTKNWEVAFEKIQEISENPNCLAVGETGFDRIWGPDISLQKKAFHAHAQLAYRLQIPLILHLVKGHDLLIEYLKTEVRVPRIIWHGYNLKSHLAKQTLDFPVYFSFGKVLTQADSNAAQWLQECPKDRIFLESDDSDLRIDSIYREASLILQLSEEELSQQLIKNWNHLSSRKIS
ncbi:TatD family hydrolase [Algoriphagus vanfongensis]|uniref:TatD family hydrolase n=1 Tax=Algoriphagus vanfongensis TaxID=426371 RepID=UPI0004202AED|nr:TatD family hydrolase [Algoriphagus vanfongensis]